MWGKGIWTPPRSRQGPCQRHWHCHCFQLQPFFGDVNLLSGVKEVYLVCFSHFFLVPVAPWLWKF